jgi:hypothetical protein
LSTEPPAGNPSQLPSARPTTTSLIIATSYLELLSIVCLVKALGA